MAGPSPQVSWCFSWCSRVSRWGSSPVKGPCVSPRMTWEAAQRLRHLFRPHVIWGSVSTIQRSECQGVHRKSIRQPGLGNCGICHTGRCRSCRGELKSLQYATFLGFLNAQWDGQSGFPAGFCFPLDVLPLPNVVPLLVPLPLESPLRGFVHCGCHGVVRGLEAALAFPLPLVCKFLTVCLLTLL